MVDAHRQNVNKARAVIVASYVQYRIGQSLQEQAGALADDLAKLAEQIPDDPARLKVAAQLTVKLTFADINEKTYLKYALIFKSL